MRDNFRVRLGDEEMVCGAQAFFELNVIFDDAVVDDDDAPRAIAVRVRVLSVGLPCVAQRVWPMP
jgi:hypothetical protein